MTRAVFYCPVSTEEQAKNLSLTTQRGGAANCRSKGYEVDKVFVEKGEPAETVNRQRFQKLLAHGRENKGCVQVIFVYNTSCFARHT